MFGTDPAGYHDGRLGYPSDLYNAIAARVAPGGTVVEIGAGTGLATRDLLDRLRPRRLVAVEPDEVLAGTLRGRIDDPRLDIVARPFVGANLPSPVDLIAAAASFHWLDPIEAFAQAKALLRPGGTIALWWNVYRQVGIGDAFADAVTPLLDGLDLPPSEGVGGHYSLDVDQHRAALSDAGFANFDARLYRRERTLDAHGLRALYASYSFVRALPDDRRDALLDAIIGVGRDRFGNAIPNVVLTPLYLAAA